MKKKLRAQVKSRFYYYFWGAATIAVVAGQLQIARGYYSMTETIKDAIGLYIHEKLTDNPEVEEPFNRCL